MVCFYQACSDVAGTIREDAKLGRSPGWNLLGDERSRLCKYAFVERKMVDGSKDRKDDLHDICDSSNCLRSVSIVRPHDEYSRSLTKMELVFTPGESRRYYKYHTPEK